MPTCRRARVRTTRGSMATGRRRASGSMGIGDVPTSAAIWPRVMSGPAITTAIAVTTRIAATIGDGLTVTIATTIADGATTAAATETDSATERCEGGHASRGVAATP